MSIEEIGTVAFGMVNAYVLKCEGSVVLVDSGIGGKFRKIERSLASIGLDCTDVSLVVLTHSHYDHSGNLSECKKTSGTPIAVHGAEVEALRTGYSIMPKGATKLGRLMVSVMSKVAGGGASFEAVEPDIVLGAGRDEPEGAGKKTAREQRFFDLHEHGFPGEAIHTPSHTAGSISLISDEGYCFPGDILFNIFPGTVMPLFADNPELLASHWRLLLDRGAKTFYPGHGRPFGRDRLESALEKKGEELGRGG